MAYIGRDLVRGQNREIDDISSSFNGSTTAFTLQTGGVNTTPGSANQLFVCLGGIMQNPNTDYSVDASTITFTTAPASGLTFWALIQGDAVDINTAADGSITTTKLATQTGNVDWTDSGKARFGSGNDLEIYHDGSKNIIKSANGHDTHIYANGTPEEGIKIISSGAVESYHDDNKKLETTATGIKVTGSIDETGRTACQFHMHTNTAATTSMVITSNWESTDFAGYGSLGSLVTESGGNFSFPSTGIWFVKFNYMAGDTDATRYTNGFINVTSNAWTNWATAAQNYGSFADYGSDAGNTGGNCEILFDVSNTTNCQVQFGVSSAVAAIFYGDSTQNWTYATFIRLGDT